MTDVATNIFPSEPVRNGYVITGVDKQGNRHRVAPTNDEDVPTASGLFIALKDRFDNPTYYTA